MREFVWRLDEMPRKGTIVVVAHGSQSLRWAYLPDGATRLDVESAITQGYRWYKSAVDCQATILKDTNITDYWRFTVLPATENMAVNKQPLREAGTIVETTYKSQVYALSEYSEANVAGVLVASAQIAIRHIPAYTSQFFERLEPSNSEIQARPAFPLPPVTIIMVDSSFRHWLWQTVSDIKILLLRS